MNIRLGNSAIILAVTLAFNLYLGIGSAVAQETDKAEPDFARGAKLWAETCSRCHNMRDPKEVRDELWDAIVTHMRIRAGLTGQDQRDILLFLQQSNSVAPVRSGAPKNTILDEPADRKKDVSPVALEKTMSDDDLRARGREIYGDTCVACHGEDGKGALPGTPDFTDKGGVLSQPRATLIYNIANGFQSPGSAMAMPAKGGNEDMTDEDIKAVLEYLLVDIAKQ